MVEPVLADLRERVRRMQCGEPTPLAPQSRTLN
jgi:hypothetical protein